MSAPKAIAADPSNTDAHVYLAMSLAKTGQYTAAVDAAEKAIGMAPDNAIAQASLGVARLGTGDQPGAEDAFNKALVIDARAKAPAEFSISSSGQLNPRPLLD